MTSIIPCGDKSQTLGTGIPKLPRDTRTVFRVEHPRANLDDCRYHWLAGGELTLTLTNTSLRNSRDSGVWLLLRELHQRDGATNISSLGFPVGCFSEVSAVNRASKVTVEKLRCHPSPAKAYKGATRVTFNGTQGLSPGRDRP